MGDKRRDIQGASILWSGQGPAGNIFWVGCSGRRLGIGPAVCPNAKAKVSSICAPRAAFFRRCLQLQCVPELEPRRKRLVGQVVGSPRATSALTHGPKLGKEEGSEPTAPSIPKCENPEATPDPS